MSRAALDVHALRERLVGGGFVTSVDVVEQTSSTNADLTAAAAAGATEGTVLVADFQSAGRGRFDRSWVSPPRAGLIVSVIVRPVEVPVAGWGWLPLLTGLAVRAAVQALVPASRAGEVALKWPNDLLLGADARKAAGILVQSAAGAAVIGVGVNVDHSATELPTAQATSLALVFGADAPGRDELLSRWLDELASRYRRWREAGGDALGCGLHEEYMRSCDTIAREVRIERREGDLIGVARSVDSGGALVIDTAQGERTLSAGDVIHLRRAAR